MPDSKSITVPLVSLIFGLSLSLMACGSESGRKREQSPAAEAKAETAPDDSIRLTPEQIRTNGIQTATAVEQEIDSTFMAVGRVTARAGGSAQVFSPFAGRLIANPVAIPRVGGFVKQGAVIAEIR